ncbi:MAG TPA: PEGA domain-containing protein, partial [Planctomycetota bacterium]|nr:PEGA domain-containing protein [Planctomycetota bacterium]
LRLESEPSGASVLVDGVHVGITPLVLHRDELSREIVQIDFELRGYLPARRTVTLGPARQDLKVELEPQTGSFRVQGAVPRATLHLFALPPEIRAPRAVASLWSLDPRSLVRALDALPPEDLPFVAERLRELTARPEEEIRSRAARLAAAAAERPAAPPVRPERTLAADALGNARIEDARVIRRYRILATAPEAADAVTEDLEPLLRQELVVPLAMTRLASVSVATRPALGRFRAEIPGGEAADVVPGGPPVRVPAGPVTLRYLPPGGDPLLREFSLAASPENGRYELSGNIYALCARAAEQSGDLEAAVRGYTKALEETAFPASEEGERRRLAERVQTLVRSSVEALPRDAVEGDLRERLSEASRRPPQEAVRLLSEAYASRRADAAVRGDAARALAAASARLRRPYEAMEWLERCAREGVDPGAAVESAVAAAIRGFPGLAERFSAVSRKIAELREVAARKPPPPPPPPPVRPAAPPRLGVIQRVHPEYGVFVRLEPEAAVAPGDVLEVVREGEPVGELTVQTLTKADATYPHGCAVCRLGKGNYQKGDEVRKK